VSPSRCGNHVTVPLDLLASTAFALNGMYIAGTGNSVVPDKLRRVEPRVELPVDLLLSATLLGSAYYGDEVNRRCAEWRGASSRQRLQRGVASTP
jgi:hypothetical protein